MPHHLVDFMTPVRQATTTVVGNQARLGTDHTSHNIITSRIVLCHFVGLHLSFGPSLGGLTLAEGHICRPPQPIRFVAEE